MFFRKLHHIYIAYAEPDGELVLRLAQDLNARGEETWIDQSYRRLSLDEDLGNQGEFLTARFYLLVLSPDAVGSSHVMHFLAYALERAMTVLPVLYRDCDLPSQLGILQCVDFRGDYASAFEGLLSVIREKRLAPDSRRHQSYGDHVS